MEKDLTFRVILLIGLVAFLPIGIYHRLKSQATRERLDRRQEGVLILLFLRLCGLLAWIGLFAWLMNAAWISWFSMPLPIWLRWIGVGMLPVYVILGSWGFRSLGKNLTDTVVTRAEHTLVTTGPYRWVRHPFYSVTFLFLVAASVVSANWGLAVVGGLACVLIVIRTRTEEAKLIERFGDEHLTYMQRTRKFLPRLALPA